MLAVPRSSCDIMSDSMLVKPYSIATVFMCGRRNDCLKPGLHTCGDAFSCQAAACAREWLSRRAHAAPRTRCPFPTPCRRSHHVKTAALRADGVYPAARRNAAQAHSVQSPSQGPLVCRSKERKSATPHQATAGHAGHPCGHVRRWLCRDRERCGVQHLKPLAAQKGMPLQLSHQ